MALGLSRRAYWLGLICWLACVWPIQKTLVHADGLVIAAVATAWAVAGMALMCARLAETEASWPLGLVPVPLSIVALGAAGAVFLQQNLNPPDAPDPVWMGPAIFALVGAALFALVVAPILIGLLPPAPRAARPPAVA